jgi:hypothetical protein
MLKILLNGALRTALFLAVTTAASAQDYTFQINQPSSGGSAQFHVQASTSGTLIGNYDAAANPAGTHTKPGLFSTPGATENVAVTVHSFNPDANGQVTFAPSGAFAAHFDLAAGSMTLADFAADLLGGGTASIPVTAAISFDSFRTSNPSSTYLGIPLTLPLGNADVSGLTATQVPGDAPGTLTPLGNNQYSFTVTPMVIIAASVTFQGSPLDVATDPTPFLLTGQITLTGETAEITESAPIDLTSSVAPALALSPIPFDLPGGAHIVFNLTLNTEDTSVQGTQSLDATGTAVPEPAMSCCIAGIAALLVTCRPQRKSFAH